jgi:hypothetical protein
MKICWYNIARLRLANIPSNVPFVSIRQAVSGVQINGNDKVHLDSSVFQQLKAESLDAFDVVSPYRLYTW